MRFKPVDNGNLGAARYNLEEETTILTARFNEVAEGDPGNLELSDPLGAIVMLDLRGGLLAGLEVVVWPEVKTLKTLRMPKAEQSGSVAARDKSEDAAMAEEDENSVEFSCNESARLLRISVVGQTSTRHVEVAEGAVVGLTSKGQIGDIWMDGLPEGIRDFL